MIECGYFRIHRQKLDVAGTQIIKREEWEESKEGKNRGRSSVVKHRGDKDTQNKRNMKTGQKKKRRLREILSNRRHTIQGSVFVYVISIEKKSVKWFSNAPHRHQHPKEVPLDRFEGFLLGIHGEGGV